MLDLIERLLRNFQCLYIVNQVLVVLCVLMCPLSLSRLSGMSNVVGPSGPGSTWDHFLLNRSQFVQLVELFLTAPLPDSVLEALLRFIHDNYTETAQVSIHTYLHATFDCMLIICKMN